MRRILFTGGAGFIGSNFLNRYVPLYPDTTRINVDCLTYAGNENNLLPEVRQAPNYFFAHADIRNKKELADVYTKYQPTDCLHCAAESHVDNSITNPSIFLETNVLGTHNLLELHKQYGLQRFHYVSTDEVYGELPENDPTAKFTESTPLAPNSPYSVSKTSGDMLTSAFHRTYGIDTVITRCSNNYGPRQHPEKLIPRFLSQLAQGKKVPLYGDGKNIRDRLFVTDHCDAMWTVFTTGVSGNVYNVGGNNEKTNRDITNILLQSFGYGHEMIEFVPDRLGHDRRYAIDSSKIQRELGWSPKVDFGTGMQETIAWYITPPTPLK